MTPLLDREQVLQLQNGTLVYVNEQERPSLAPLMLAYFSGLSGTKRVLELCAGSGVCSFWLWDRGLRGETVLVDKRGEPLKLAQKTAAANGFSGIVTVTEDAAFHRTPARYDAILCNPPFFLERQHSADADKDAQRHENGLSPTLLCSIVARHLKQRGRFFCCYTPQRLPELMQAMLQQNIQPKRMRFCRHSASRDPFLVLLEGRMQGGKGLMVEPDLLVKKENGEPGDEMAMICERGEA